IAPHSIGHRGNRRHIRKHLYRPCVSYHNGLGHWQRKYALALTALGCLAAILRQIVWRQLIRHPAVRTGKYLLAWHCNPSPLDKKTNGIIAAVPVSRKIKPDK